MLKEAAVVYLYISALSRNKKNKEVPLHAMVAFEGKGSIASTHS
jgi:hypothetical protein